MMSGFLRKLGRLYKSDTNFLVSVVLYLYKWCFYKVDLLCHDKVRIKGIKNISSKDTVNIGLGKIGFSYRKDVTVVSVRGSLNFNGKYSIGRACRIDIGPQGVIEFGVGGYVNCNSIFIIMHRLIVGDNCVISWNCQFLDDDFHRIVSSDDKNNDNGIVIGDNVWIGCNVKIYKGVHIPDGCVIASDTVIKKSFEEKNVLIAGNPASIVKRDVIWTK